MTVNGTPDRVVELASGSSGSSGGGSSVDPVVKGALTDRSGTFDTPGTAEQAMALNANRRYLTIQNPLVRTDGTTAETEDLHVAIGATAVVGNPSIVLIPGSSLTFEGSFVPTGAVSVIGPGEGWVAYEGSS